MEALRAEQFKPSKAKRLSKMLDIADDEYVNFKHTLAELAKEGQLIRLPRNRYALTDSCEKLIIGKIQTVKSGEYGFLIPDDKEAHPDDVYISRRDLRGAMNGDRVLVRIKRRRRRRRREQEGRLEAGVVEKIIKRGKTSFVGVLQQAGGQFYIIPQGDKSTLPSHRIPLARSDAKDVGVGEKILVRMPEEHNPGAKVYGEIVEVLGSPLDPGVEEKALLVEFGIDTNLPEDVVREEEALLLQDWTEEIKRREDFRNVYCVTIDPSDAYDFDDAISVKKNGKGYCLMVHIADVSYFVKEGTAIDKMAQERLNSIYLPGTVIPMLPEALTKQVACLKEGEDKLAKTVIIRINENGETEETKFVKSVINNKKRLSYEEAEEIIEGRLQTDDEIRSMLEASAELAELLRTRRIRRGAIDMEIPEEKVILGADGSVRDIVLERRLRSHNLIEEFMLIANQSVAEYLKKAGVVFIRRVHEPPDKEAMRHFETFVTSLGLHIASTKTNDLQKLLRAVSGKPLSLPVNYALLRSMRRALYTTKEEGHFALAADDYTHFTAPIRRYVDLTVHRALDRLLMRPRQKWSAKDISSETDYETLSSVAQAASEKEETTDRLEREFLKLKACYLLKDRVGETFDGLIVSVGERAFWVLLSRPSVEGVVPERLFKRRLEFDPATFTLTSRERKKSFRIGQQIKVRLVAVDIPSRTILLFPV